MSSLRFYTQKGFTLVELAIVLMIIGLLVGGILRGQELMNNARVTSTVQQIKAYEGALTSFRDAYAAMPGDMLLATSRLPGCNSVNTCQNGNGDGALGTPSYAWAIQDSLITLENAQFWKHLALAHLISGVDPGMATSTAGRSHPKTPFGGAFVVLNTQTTWPGSSTSFDGIIVRPQGNIAGAPEANAVLSPHMIAQIDRKIDDGMPFSGSIRSTDAFTADNAGPCEGQSYNETMEQNLCGGYFKIAN